MDLCGPLFGKRVVYTVIMKRRRREKARHRTEKRIQGDEQMNKQEFLEKYDNSKAYGWVAYTVSSCGYHGWTTVYSVGMTREEAEEKAVRDHRG